MDAVVEAQEAALASKEDEVVLVEVLVSQGRPGAVLSFRRRNNAGIGL